MDKILKQIAEKNQTTTDEVEKEISANIMSAYLTNNQDTMNQKSHMIIYKTEDGLTKIETTFDEDTVWLSIDQMAELFQRDKSTISRHIKNIFTDTYSTMVNPIYNQDIVSRLIEKLFNENINISEDIISLTIAIPFFCRTIKFIDNIIWIAPIMMVIIYSFILTST